MTWPIIKDCFSSPPSSAKSCRVGRRSRSLPAGYVFRARLILALGEGKTYRQIENSLGASAPTVSKWKGRFEEQGMEGLQGRVIRRAQQKPGDGSTHWSVRKLSEAMGLSKSMRLARTLLTPSIPCDQNIYCRVEPASPVGAIHHLIGMELLDHPRVYRVGGRRSPSARPLHASSTKTACPATVSRFPARTTSRPAIVSMPAAIRLANS
jgi:hypothetical protein